MMEMVIIPVMSVFTVTMDQHGRKLEKTLMGKRQVTFLASLFLYPKMVREWLLEHLIMMKMDFNPVMYVFTITMEILGRKLEKTLMGKRNLTVVASQFLCHLMV